MYIPLSFATDLYLEITSILQQQVSQNVGAGGAVEGGGASLPLYKVQKARRPWICPRSSSPPPLRISSPITLVPRVSTGEGLVAPPVGPFQRLSLSLLDKEGQPHLT